MKKICVFTLYDEKGASSYYRAFIYKEKIDKNFESKWFYFWNNKYVTKYMHDKKKNMWKIIFLYIKSLIKRLYQIYFIAPKYDIIFIQKEIIPKIKSTFLSKLKKKGVRIIYDVDDAIYTDQRDNSSKIASFADIVICGNDTLKKYYSSFNNNCIILPTVEQTFKYKPYWKNTFENKIIGWIGSKTTIDNLDIVINAINEIANKYPNVQFNIISNTALEYTNKIKNSKLILWDKDRYIEELGEITIGIMPLKDNEINRGKCGFKLMQYLNMKKPVIASDVGVNSKIVSNNGIIANNTEEWENALEKLLFNEEEYKKYIDNIEEEFFKKYDFDIVANRLLNILSKDIKK